MSLQKSDRFLRLPEVLYKTGMARSTIYLWISEDKFPKQISLGVRSSAWLESEIIEWMKQKLEKH